MKIGSEPDPAAQRVAREDEILAGEDAEELVEGAELVRVACGQ